MKRIKYTHFSGEVTEAQMASTPFQSLQLIKSEQGLTTKLLWEYLVPKPILGVCPLLLLDRQTGPGWWADAVSSVEVSEL